MWHISLSKKEMSRPVNIDCFPGKMKHMRELSHQEKIYEVIHDHDMPWPEGKKLILETDSYRLLKCEARDKNGDVISLQYYIVSQDDSKSRLLLRNFY